MQYSSLIPSIISLAVDAGGILMKHFQAGGAVDIKADNSPVTQADIEADNYISAALRKLTPNIPVISEEGDYDNMPHTSTYWLVDPLDGTRSFINGEKEFTVNIGLVVNNRAYMGVIYAPALDALYYTGEDGKAYKVNCHPERSEGSGEILRFAQNDKIHIKVAPAPSPAEGYRIIASKNHRNKLTEDYIKTLNVKEFLPASSSYKFCLIAEGKADIYPRFGNTMQWDTAAGQAILEAAGGRVVCADGGEFLYKFNHLDVESLRNGHFVASN